VKLSRNETAPPPADLPDAEAKADPPLEPAAAARTRTFGRLVERPRTLVRKPVVDVVHHRSYSGAYARYGGWGRWDGGWAVLSDSRSRISACDQARVRPEHRLMSMRRQQIVT
jgi:hypothetical protein